jgi:hypothetical protein
MLSTDRESVLAQNDAFYRAIESLDDQAMAVCWTQSDADVCIHPGWPILRGWDAVVASWRAIFAGTTYMRFVVSDVHVELQDDTAQVTCLETLYSISPMGTAQAQVAATNVYVRTADGWRMRLHHGSPVQHAIGPDEDAGEEH